MFLLAAVNGSTDYSSEAEPDIFHSTTQPTWWEFRAACKILGSAWLEPDNLFATHRSTQEIAAGPLYEPGGGGSVGCSLVLTESVVTAACILKDY